MSRVDIQVGSFSLQSSTITTESISHDGGLEQQINILEVSRKDGAKLISTNYRPRTITLRGAIKGNTQQIFEDSLDEFKKSIYVSQGNLDLEYAGGFRRYVVATRSAEIGRRHFNINHVQWSIEFVVLDPPFAQAISGLNGQYAVNEVLSAVNITSQSYEATVTFGGTAPPKPRIDYLLDSKTGLRQIDFGVRGKSPLINISTYFTVGDRISIDTVQPRVLRNDRQIRFGGIFPEFDLGSNTIFSRFREAGIVDQEQTVNTSPWHIFPTNFKSEEYKVAMSFQPSVTGNYSGLNLLLRRDPSSSQDTNFTARIETNAANGFPSGSLVTGNATKTLNSSQFPPDLGWVSFAFPADVPLTSGTTYWIVLSFIAVTSGQLIVDWGASGTDVYANGNAAYFTTRSNAGKAGWFNYPQVDMCFQLFKSGAPAWMIDKNVTYVRRYL